MRWLYPSVVVVAIMASPMALAQESLCDQYESVPMPEDERQRITLSLLERYPELASSPGIKAADASPICPGETQVTNVIFYPHTENHGIKEAFQALCGRTYVNKTWTCEEVTIRRYLQLASQDFEVRIVRSEITSEAALAVIEASRRDLQTVTDATDRPDTAIIIMPHLDLGITWGRAPNGTLGVVGLAKERGDPEVLGYRVTWGTPEGYSKVTMLAKLAEGGDPADPDDWHASVFKSPAQQ